jgi:hypothetical protein
MRSGNVKAVWGLHYRVEGRIGKRNPPTKSSYGQPLTGQRRSHVTDNDIVNQVGHARALADDRRIIAFLLLTVNFCS